MSEKAYFIGMVGAEDVSIAAVEASVDSLPPEAVVAFADIGNQFHLALRDYCIKTRRPYHFCVAGSAWLAFANSDYASLEILLRLSDEVVVFEGATRTARWLADFRDKAGLWGKLLCVVKAGEFLDYGQ